MRKKTKRTKRNSLLLSAIILLVSCRAGDQVRLRIEMPRKPPVGLENYKEIIVTNFLVKEEAQDFDINKELEDYFVTELGQNLDKKISTLKTTIDSIDIFDDQDFWKGMFPDKREAFFFTGSAEYTQEIRKSIKSASKRRFETPFPEESRIEERSFYSLSLQLLLIDSESGEALYKRTFKESKSYQNPNQTAPFAFHDLMMTAKVKLFREILGEKQIQERYLIK